jgi:hypothetical protein
MRVRMSALTELAHFLATTKLNVAGSAVCSTYVRRRREASLRPCEVRLTVCPTPRGSTLRRLQRQPLPIRQRVAAPAPVVL